MASSCGCAEPEWCSRCRQAIHGHALQLTAVADGSDYDLKITGKLCEKCAHNLVRWMHPALLPDGGPEEPPSSVSGR